MVHRRQHVGVGHEGRIDRHLDTRSLPIGRRLLAFLSCGRCWRGDRLDDAKQPDGVAQLPGELDVEFGDVPDALGVDRLGPDPETVGQRGQDPDLVGGVMAVDVERGFRLGVAQALGIGEDLGELGSLELHPRQDVVAGAIDDAGDARDPIAGERFAQGLDDRDAPGHGGLVIQVGAVLGGQGEQFGAMGREQGLVGGDHGLAELEGRPDHLARGRHPAHQFHHDLHLRVVDHFAPIARQHRRGHGETAGPLRIAHGHASDVQSNAQPRGHEIAIALQRLPHAPADRASADQTQVDLIHHRSPDIAPGRSPGTTGFFEEGFRPGRRLPGSRSVPVGPERSPHRRSRIPGP